MVWHKNQDQIYDRCWYNWIESLILVVKVSQPLYDTFPHTNYVNTLFLQIKAIIMICFNTVNAQAAACIKTEYNIYFSVFLFSYIWFFFYFRQTSYFDFIQKTSIDTIFFSFLFFFYFRNKDLILVLEILKTMIDTSWLIIKTLNIIIFSKTIAIFMDYKMHPGYLQAYTKKKKTSEKESYKILLNVI